MTIWIGMRLLRRGSIYNLAAGVASLPRVQPHLQRRGREDASSYAVATVRRQLTSRQLKTLKQAVCMRGYGRGPLLNCHAGSVCWVSQRLGPPAV
eukprot:6001939-Pyramimonas_sp.AAC.1